MNKRLKVSRSSRDETIYNSLDRLLVSDVIEIIMSYAPEHRYMHSNPVVVGPSFDIQDHFIQRDPPGCCGNKMWIRDASHKIHILDTKSWNLEKRWDAEIEDMYVSSTHIVDLFAAQCDVMTITWYDPVTLAVQAQQGMRAPRGNTEIVCFQVNKDEFWMLHYPVDQSNYVFSIIDASGNMRQHPCILPFQRPRKMIIVDPNQVILQGSSPFGSDKSWLQQLIRQGNEFHVERTCECPPCDFLPDSDDHGVFLACWNKGLVWLDWNDLTTRNIRGVEDATLIVPLHDGRMCVFDRSVQKFVLFQ